MYLTLSNINQYDETQIEMISILRRLKFESISSRYITYAIGETLLIIIGILIALGMGNWVEEREFAQYEKIMLRQISTSLKANRESIDLAYLPRLERKEKAIAELMELSSSGKTISDIEIERLLSTSMTDFLFSYDSGAYEALKMNGIDRLSNPELRTRLVGFYDSFLPKWKVFIDSINDRYNPRITEARFELIIPKFEYRGDNNLVPVGSVIVEDIYNHPAFAETVVLEWEKAINQRNRINRIIEEYDELIADIDSELAE